MTMYLIYIYHNQAYDKIVLLYDLLYCNVVKVIQLNLFSNNLHDNNVIVKTSFNRLYNIFARK